MKILNTNYKIKLLDKEDDIFDIGSCWGYCDTEKKEICVAKNHKEIKKFYLHELIHAILYEQGNETKSSDEELVETITSLVIQLMKMLKVWDKWKI